MRVLWSFNPQQGCWYPAVGLVLELRRRGHEVVGLSGPSVATTLDALGIELRTDQIPPWPWDSGLGSGPPADLDQAAVAAGMAVCVAPDEVDAERVGTALDRALGDDGGHPRIAGTSLGLRLEP
jgi:hypothetical protein